jgi:hypothetical protein
MPDIKWLLKNCQVMFFISVFHFVLIYVPYGCDQTILFQIISKKTLMCSKYIITKTCFANWKTEHYIKNDNWPRRTLNCETPKELQHVCLGPRSRRIELQRGDCREKNNDGLWHSWKLSASENGTNKFTSKMSRSTSVTNWRARSVLCRHRKHNEV